jgi:hypothetical protein
MFFGVPTPVLSLSKGSNLPALGDCFGKTKSASQRHVPRLCSYTLLGFFLCDRRVISTGAMQAFVFEKGFPLKTVEPKV